MKLCKNCNKTTNGDRYNFCCKECKDIFFYEYRECKTCKTLFKVRKKSKKQFCDMKCVINNSDIKLKMVDSRKKVFLEKYGKESYTQTNEFKDKTKNTNLKKYGVEYPQQNKQIRNKKEETNLIKYGHKNAAKNSVVIEKANKTRLSKYDNSYFGIIAKKRKKEIYGDENYNNIEKNKKTCLEKYGVDNVSKIDIIKERIKENHLNTFYNRLVNDDRFKKIITPLFSLDNYNGVYSINDRYLYKFKCNFCNTEFDCKLGNGSIPRCPICFPYSISKPQQEILDFIKSILPTAEEIISNTRLQIAPLELDIYIPGRKLAIEFNGLYWHNEANGKGKYYHLNKTVKCESKGIQLIHIFEDEWVNKQETVKNILKSVLLTPDFKINVIDLEIKEVELSESEVFLSKYHIEGYDNLSEIRIGAYYNNELVAMLLLDFIENREYKINGYCSKVFISGIFDKLLKCFIDNYKPLKIVSYVSRRFLDINLYKSTEFKLSNRILPQCWYVVDDNRYNSHDFYRNNDINKSIIFDKVWDCGYLKYEWQVTDNN